MKYAIVASSLTGNTRAVGQAIAEALGDDVLYCGKPDAAALEADVIFAGFWTDKGSCADDLTAFLANCAGRKIALFGTAGFGGDPAYFETLLGSVRAKLPQDAEYLGGWMCQGRMPAGVRARYAAALEKDPEDAHMKSMLENFDRALAHPDDTDFAAAKAFARSIKEAL